VSLDAAVVCEPLAEHPAVAFGILGLVPFLRYAVLMARHEAGGHLQSLLLGALLLIVAAMSLMLGVIADLIRTNRILVETTLEHTKRLRFGRSATEIMRVG